MCETIKSIGLFYISVFLIVKVWEIHSSHEPIKLGQVGIGHSQKSMVEIGPRTDFKSSPHKVVFDDGLKVKHVVQTDTFPGTPF